MHVWRMQIFHFKTYIIDHVLSKHAQLPRALASSLSCTRVRSITTAPCTSPLVAIPGVPLLSGMMVTCSSGPTVIWRCVQVRRGGVSWHTNLIPILQTLMLWGDHIVSVCHLWKQRVKAGVPLLLMKMESSLLETSAPTLTVYQQPPLLLLL